MPINADSKVTLVRVKRQRKKCLAWILSLQVRWNGECHCGFFLLCSFLFLRGQGEGI
jgi:hypothetical protein